MKTFVLVLTGFALMTPALAAAPRDAALRDCNVASDQEVFVRRIAIRQGTAALRFLSRLHVQSWTGALITTTSAARSGCAARHRKRHRRRDA